MASRPNFLQAWQRFSEVNVPVPLVGEKSVGKLVLILK